MIKKLKASKPTQSIGAIEKIERKLNIIESIVSTNNTSFRYQKLAKFCEETGVDPKTIKKYFPESVYKKGVWWVDKLRIQEAILG